MGSTRLVVLGFLAAGGLGIAFWPDADRKPHAAAPAPVAPKVDRHKLAARAALEVPALPDLALTAPSEVELLDATWEAETAGERLRERQVVVDDMFARRAAELLARGVPPENLAEEMSAQFGELREQLVLGELTAEESAELERGLAEGARGFQPTEGDLALDAQVRAELNLPAELEN
jgi:hypothetical protein